MKGIKRKMTKAEFVAAVAAKTGASKKDAAENVNAVFEVLTEVLTAHDDFTMQGFGSFKSVYKEASEARNPSNGETVAVPAHYTVKFKASGALKDAVK